MLQKAFTNAMQLLIETYTNEEDTANPLAFPILATKEELTSLPATLIITEEFDPNRDAGERYYDNLLEAGVKAQCVRLMGATHGSLIHTKFTGHLLHQARALLVAWMSSKTFRCSPPFVTKSKL